MRTSQYLFSTLKETPNDAQVVSHQLMLRAGMIRPMASGLYNWLPTGIRVLKKVEKIIREEMIPIFLKSDDPEVVFFGQLLQENNISPHIFRHWYTTQLVLSGVNEVSELMSARGDNSPESAWVYLQNKGEIAKQYGQVNNGVFEYMNWQAEKLFGED